MKPKKMKYNVRLLIERNNRLKKESYPKLEEFFNSKNHINNIIEIRADYISKCFHVFSVRVNV